MEIAYLLNRFCDYSTFIRGYSPDTIIRYRQVVTYYCKTAEITDIEQITEKNVRDYFYFGREIKKWKASTFITKHKTLVVFFRWCITEGHMKTNFADDIETPRLEKRLPPKLTRKEALRLLETVYNFPYSYKFSRSRNHAIFATFIYAGLRKKELLNLKFTDIDLDNMSIFINQGKGSKDRILPICSKLADSLQRYLIDRKRLRKTCPEFFVSLNHNMGFTVNGLAHLVKKLRKSTDIQFTIHKLRHTFATLMIEGGCDIYSLSRMMGHSDIKTTTIYLAATAEHLRNQIKKHPLNII